MKIVNTIRTTATGILSLSLYTLNIMICAIILCLIGVCYSLTYVLFFKKLKKPLQCHLQKFFYRMPIYWARVNYKIFKLLTRTEITVDIPPELSPQKAYLVIANHQSWTDIFILFNIFHDKIPLLKFFMKQSLKFLPFAGQICMLYDFPFLHRYTSAELKKNPDYRQKDIQNTQKACEKFKKTLGSLVIFTEGTRFTQAKQQKQHSPYRYLLKPKSGGVALALTYLHDTLHTLIDVTIAYTEKKPSFWSYCCGTMPVIAVNIQLFNTDNIYAQHPPEQADFRIHLQQFLNQRWAEKDLFIQTFQQEHEKYII